LIIKKKIDSVAFEKLKNQQAWESEHNELTVLKRGREELYQKKTRNRSKRKQRLQSNRVLQSDDAV